MEVVLILFLTLLNGAFAMSEMALSSARKARLAAMAEAGDSGAAKALELMDSPTRFLSTVQVGITSIGMLNGIVGEAAFSAPLAKWLQSFGLAANWSSWLALIVVVSTITFVTIIFGELVPKRIAQMHPEVVARWVSRPMRFVAGVAKPFVLALSASTQGVLKLLRLDKDPAREVTEAEIAASLEEGVDAGVIEAHEHQMVRNVFHLDDRALTTLMVPRSDIQWLDTDETIATSLEKSAQSAHSCLAVCRGGLDDVAGTVTIHKLVAAQLAGQGAERSSSVMEPAVFVPESLTGMELLEQLREQSARMVFVVDEYGVVQGLVTPRDLLEAITGELRPEVATDAWATPRADGSWLIEGQMPVNEFKTRLDIPDLPDEDKARYATVAGLWLAIAGRLPREGEAVDCGDWQLEVIDLDGRRIDKLLAVRRIQAP
jgi:putative hemolysin